MPIGAKSEIIKPIIDSSPWLAGASLQFSNESIDAESSTVNEDSSIIFEYFPRSFSDCEM